MVQKPRQKSLSEYGSSNSGNRDRDVGGVGRYLTHGIQWELVTGWMCEDRARKERRPFPQGPGRRRGTGAGPSREEELAAARRAEPEALAGALGREGGAQVENRVDPLWAWGAPVAPQPEGRCSEKTRRPPKLRLSSIPAPSRGEPRPGRRLGQRRRRRSRPREPREKPEREE